jgi:hypothetical protein
MAEIFKVGDWVVRKEKYRGGDWKWVYGDGPLEVKSSLYNNLTLVDAPGVRGRNWSAYCFDPADPPNQPLSDFL